MYEYLNDPEFLTKLDKLTLRTQYAKITLLSFDEKPIGEIQGNVVSGSLNIDANSSCRRTISLTMLADVSNSNLENTENQISIKRKVKIEIGYNNPLKSYVKYGDVIWFPCGLFVLSKANISRATNGWNISISGRDKMSLLDGTMGGTFPASITFHEAFSEINSEVTEIVYPTIYQIIFEAVHHYGGESASNIIITDIGEDFIGLTGDDNQVQCKVRQLMKYAGDRAIYFNDDKTAFSFNPIAGFDTSLPISYGEDAGYRITDFTYPGELVLKAGDTVINLLDKIVDVLGNFEYFYDLDGHFIFQEIKNYLNTQSPLSAYYDSKQQKWVNPISETDYIKTYSNAKFLYSLTDLDTTTAITITPNYDNIKNDFIVWGKRKLASGYEQDIRYHLAIDAKPTIYRAKYYMVQVGDIIRYEYLARESVVGNSIILYNPENPSKQYTFTMNSNGQYAGAIDGYESKVISPPCQVGYEDWREELYRGALEANVTNGEFSDYDRELLAEWRKLFDPGKSEWQSSNGWNPDVYNAPASLNFWLDFIDTGSEVGKYSVNEIGRRTKVVNNSNIKSIYNKEAPDLVFIDNKDDINYYTTINQKYFLLAPEYQSLFVPSSTGASCFDEIRNMLYQNLNYNTTIQLTCLPKYYMEPNNIIYIEDKESNIKGNYQITRISLPLAYNGTMSITATEVLTRV